MPHSVSLRKTLRTIPIFQLLPRQELDIVLDCFARRDYQPGETLWRAGNRLDFIGVIQSGEMLVEYGPVGSRKRSTRLSAGDFIQPLDRTVGNTPSSVSAYAVTALTLYVLHQEQLAALCSTCSTLDTILEPRQGSLVGRSLWSGLWWLAVVLVISVLVWRDVAGALSGVFYLAAEYSARSANYSEALERLDCALRLDPEAALAHNQEGYIHFQMEHLQSATAAFGRALDADEACGATLNNLAATCFLDGFIEQAARLQQKAGQVNPNVDIVQYNLGLILMQQREYDRAIGAFREASRINPNWALPQIQLSASCLQKMDYAEAEHAARIATRLEPAQHAAHLSLALALHYQGRNQEALTSVERAIEIEPDDVVSKFYKALILDDLGNSEMALQTLQRVLESSEDPKQQSRILAEIESLLH
jgi:tetratricopeptide (TPR) repeat protein